MRLRIHHRLFAGFLGVVALLVTLTVALVGRGLRRDLTATLRDDLGRQLDMGAWLVAAYPDAPLDSLAREVTRRIGYRVTFIDPDGVVVGDSYVAPARLGAMESHATRPEVVAALDGRAGFAERTSATLGTPLLYAARRVARGRSSVVLRVAAPLDGVERAVARARTTAFTAAVAATPFALLLAYVLSVALARPLAVLAEQARRLARGDFGRRAPRGTAAPEVDDLAHALNRLTDELRGRLAELGRERDEMRTLIDCMAEGVVALTDDARILRTNRAARKLLRLPEGAPYAPVGTVIRHPELRDVLERSVVGPLPAREIELEGRQVLVASRALDLGGAVTTLLDVSDVRRMERVRRDFVANASHELKTPLTAIRGFAETLLEEDPPGELRARFLAHIRDHTLRLQRLVDDLLDLSRLESGAWVTQSGPVSVTRTARSAWEPYAPPAEEKGVAFTIEGDLEVHADAAGLEQIFRNLLENALRHTDPGGTIRVRAERSGRDVVVEVIDDGEGIPSRALPRVFERFFRADSSRARDFGGTGLGLAIVRHLAGAMGGRVEAESELGRGTTIRLRLPAE